MAGFSADWLALREPSDHGAVNAVVRHALCQHFAGRDSLRIVDLGSGTGSNLRGLSPYLTARQSWTLVDHDPGLLALVHPPAGADLKFETTQRDLSGGDIRELVDGADLVTASALFDLVSSEMIARMARQIADAGAVFYTVLTYDGIVAWLPGDPLDGAMRALFNKHQQTDKGFGPAAGPTATDRLAEAFSAAGYTIHRGSSPWVVSESKRALRLAIDEGWAGSVRDLGELSSDDIDAWLQRRLSANDGVTIVGHEDLLALPPTPSAEPSK